MVEQAGLHGDILSDFLPVCGKPNQAASMAGKARKCGKSGPRK
jgi:hypothetical protein